jgi:hypothetical protein
MNRTLRPKKARAGFSELNTLANTALIKTASAFPLPQVQPLPELLFPGAVLWLFITMKIGNNIKQCDDRIPAGQAHGSQGSVVNSGYVESAKVVNRKE